MFNNSSIIAISLSLFTSFSFSTIQINKQEVPVTKLHEMASVIFRKKLINNINDSCVQTDDCEQCQQALGDFVCHITSLDVAASSSLEENIIFFDTIQKCCNEKNYKRINE